MQAFYTDEFMLSLPPTHTFPMEKYARLRRKVVANGILAASALRIPPGATDEQLLRVHDPDYVRRVVSGTLAEAEVREIGLPWSPGLVERSRRSTGATISACLAALEDGVSVNLAGGTHHAARAKGAGYCVFNDAAVAARELQAKGLARRVLIVDCDVHHGDGTASIFADDPTVFTFSIHGAKNYPLRKPPSDLDVPLPDKTGDDEYLAALRPALEQSIERAGADLAIYLAGADPYEGDRLGRMSLTEAGLAARDRLVLGRLRGVGLPVAVAMAGGYAREIDRTVAIQAETVRICVEHAR